MSATHPRTRKSRSPAQRSGPNSPRSSQSSKRRPLHERSDSEANAAGLTATSREEASDIYGKSAFPTLPSQFFPPSQQQYIYEDENALPGHTPPLPSASLGRSAYSSSVQSSWKGKERIQSAAKSPRSEWENESLMTPSDSIASPRTDAGATWDSRSAQTRTDSRAQYRSWAYGEPVLYSDEDSAFASNLLGGAVEKENFARYAYYQPPSPQPAVPAAQTARQETNPPLRPRSSTASLAPQPLRLIRSFESAEESGGSHERPRSATNPDGSPTEAFLEALIQSGTNIKYPVLRKPSATSLRTTDSGNREAFYPPPLRLQRKRAFSHLSRTASGAEMAEDNEAGRRRRPGLKPSYSTNSMISAVSSVPSLPDPREWRDAQGNVGWNDEVNDTLSDLNARSLRPQSSMNRMRSFSDSRPTSAHSTSSRPGHFYSFFNDSVTAWARYYYRGDDRFRLETPPEITRIERAQRFDNPPPQPPRTPPSRLNGSSTTSGPSQSPPSAGFYQEAIYIPRVRPLRTQIPAPPRTESEESETSPLPEPLPPIRPTANVRQERPVEQEREREQEQEPEIEVERQPEPQLVRVSQPLPPQSYNRTPELPHLSPDKRVTMFLPRWDAPSFDDERKGKGFIINQTNRQIFLFCLGFIFPLSWMLASVLPIPSRPEMLQIEPSGPYDREVTINDLLNRQEVLKYQKTRWWRNLNRWMSATGVCVVAAVIVCAVIATK